MRACGQKLVTFCAHTHTHAAKLVVEISLLLLLLLILCRAASSAALSHTGGFEWEVESTTGTHSSADWWDLLLSLA